MRTFIILVCLLAAALALPVGSRAQCQPGFTGPFTHTVVVSNQDPVHPGWCTFIVHYCIKTWIELGNTRFSYDYWIETQDCPLSAMTQDQAAKIYSAINDQLLVDNPAEFEYSECGSEYRTTLDFSHANCVYELIVHHATPEDPNAKDTYEYHNCPGSGLCYERSLVCWQCRFGHAPGGGCNPAPPGQSDRDFITSQKQSWTTGSNDCGTYNTSWGEVQCMTVCNADKPGPDLGMVGSIHSPTLVVGMIQATPQPTTLVEHQHAAKQQR